MSNKIPKGNNEMIEKLGAMVVQGNDEDRFWVLVNNVIENRSKINELIDQRKKDKANRDKQMNDLHRNLQNQIKELKYNNELLEKKLKQFFLE